MTDEVPEWDGTLAEKLLGARILVGLTRREADGDHLLQFFGVVTDAHPRDGITLELEGSRAGETYRLPPDLRAFHPAPPGSYRLRQTGEVVIDPDYTTTWEVTPPLN